jgi:hypothetical protein
MRMGERARVAQQVLFGQLRGTRPVGSSPVSLCCLMRKDVRLIGGGDLVHGRRCYHGGLASTRCFEVFRSLHGLEIHWKASKIQHRPML